QTFEIRPDVVAPGSMVYSAAPEYINDKNEDVEDYSVAYQRMSGTSMAAPHIAGIAALILQENPEYTPTDVKNAIMNTSEHIHQKSGVSYSVHETGAGRVNAFEAVHEKVSFSAEYEAFAGENRESLDNITGMLSYGKIMIPEEGTISKTIPVTVTNNTDTAKKYSIEIEYSDSERAKDAEGNGVKLDLPGEVTVAPGASEKFDVTISSPNTVESGTYEGFIHFTEVGADENIYQMPFSATILKSGFAVLTYPTLGENGYGKGLTGFTSSNLYNRHSATLFTSSDIAVEVQVNEPIKYIETYAIDPETKERIGYGGKQDASWFPMGVSVGVENFFGNGKAKKIVNGKVSHEEFPLATGIYELEVIATDYDGKSFSGTLPMGIVNDNTLDKISFNMKEGIIEVNDDNYTKEVWYDGKEHEGLWLEATVYNEIVDKMIKDSGLDFLKQEELNNVYAEGTERTGSSFQMETMAKEDGKIMIAGVEKSDLAKGLFRVELSHLNPGRTTSKPTSFTFVNEGSSYLSLNTNTEKVSKGSVLNTGITLNNGQNVAKGSFSIKNQGEANLKNAKITPSAELKALVGEKNIVTNITFNDVVGEWDSYEEFQVSFDLTSAGEDFKGLTGDIKLFDISYEVESIDGIKEDLMYSGNFMYTTLKGMDGEFKNIEDEVVDVMAGTMFKNLNLEFPDRTLIYGSTSTPWPGMKEANIYAVDPSGKKYEPTYLILDEVGRSHRFAFNNLPVIDGDYKVILETPGCFDSIMNVPGSTVNKDNKRVGNTFAITTYSFFAPSMTAYAGDVNGDGAIDIVDAAEVGKVYEEGTPHWFSLGEEKTLVTDLTQDGVVNYFDMLLLLNNYMMQDLSRRDSKVPEETIDGRDIIDILESCGYYDEGYEDGMERNVTLNMDKERSFVGDEVKFEAVPPTEEVEFEYEFAVREKNDKDWTVIQEKSTSRSTIWKSTIAGDYEFKVRIFLDDIEYVCQDNKLHTVSWQELKGITLDKETLDLNTGSEDKLTVSLNPWNARPQEFVWSTSDEAVATVVDGKVVAKKAGDATITVKTANGDFSAACKVKVTDVALESISLNKEKLELNKGEEDKLEVTFMPENATNKKVTWASVDEKIATVKDGKVVAVNPGTTVITVTSADGKLSDTCIVTVKESEVPPTKPVAEKITLDNHDAKLKIGEKLILKAKITPGEAAMPELGWTSSNEKVATVKDGVVTAIGEGKVTITVKSKDGKLSDTCKIAVSKDGSGSNLPQTGAIGAAVGSSGLLASAGLMTLAMSTLILVGKKKENDEE
ncbi:MAG: Ig-like domain-containing protein, partial [Clostridium sp.]